MRIFMKNVTLLWGIVLVALAGSPGIAKAIDLRDWGRKIDDASLRFQALRSFNGEAVLDRETQLVWERSPSSNTFFEWGLALADSCDNKIVGGRKGWRAPTVEELASLVDPSQTSPSLANGHPFTNVDTSRAYWTSTTVPNRPSAAEIILFSEGVVNGIDKTSLVALHVWCVRGRQGVRIACRW
jgi:hypothetical protein